MGAHEASRAAAEDGYSGEASAVEATLVSFTGGGKRVADGYLEGKAPTTPAYRDPPAWVVTFHDACIPIFGGRSLHGLHVPRCQLGDIHVVIDATNGRSIDAYSRG